MSSRGFYAGAASALAAAAALWALTWAGCVPGGAPAAGGSSAAPGTAPGGRSSPKLDNLDPALRKAIERVNADIRRQRGSVAAPGAAPARSEGDMLLELMRSKTGAAGFVEGTVVDRRTREPLAARVRITDQYGMLAGDEGGGWGFLADGRFRAAVLAGRAVVEVTAGRRRTPWRFVVAVRPGATVTVAAELERPEQLDIEARGWMGADLRYAVGGPRRLKGEATMALAALAARAEGLGAVVLVRPWAALAAPGATGDPAAAVQTRELLARPEVLAARCRMLSGGEAPQAAGQGPGSLRRPLVLWGYHRGGLTPYGGVLGLGLADWRALDERSGDILYPNLLACGEIRRQGGLSVYTEPSRAVMLDPVSIAALNPTLAGYYGRAGVACAGLASELPFDTVAGPTYGAVELSGSDADERTWFRLLSEGYRVPAVAASGAALEAGGLPAERTLALVGSDRTERGLLDAVRRGRCVVSFGPYIFMDVGGASPGDEVEASPRTLRATVAAISGAEARSPLAKVEIIRNGQVVVEEKAARGQVSMAVTAPLREESSAWFVARATDVAGRRAWTSPIYFIRKGEKPRRPAETKVSATVVDAATGKPLAGKVRVLDPWVLDPSGAATEEREFSGELAMSAPARSCLEFAVPGYEGARRLLFFETASDELVRDIHTNERGRGAEELELPATYVRARTACATAAFEVRLRRELGR